MALPISRKYRPQIFKDLVGQNHIRTTLINEVEKGQIAHAYLFCGPRGTGKTTTARILAKSINCTKRKKGEGEPCNSCPSCTDMNLDRSLDVIEIDAASHTGVDNVRENIIENVRFLPQKNICKVFIIDEVHMLSLSAFNALLKTLEEPPKHVVFILATTELHKVPLTIVSRTQRFQFKKVSVENLIGRLRSIAMAEKMDVEDEVFEGIARASDGCIRDAENLLAQITALGEKRITSSEASLILPHSDISLVLQLLEFLSKKQTSSAIELINTLIDQGIELQHFLEDLIEMARSLLLSKIRSSVENLSQELSPDLSLRAGELLNFFSLEELYQIIELFLGAKTRLKNSFILQLPLELAVVSFTEKISFSEEDQEERDVSDKKKKTDSAARSFFQSQNLNKQQSSEVKKPAASSSSQEVLEKPLQKSSEIPLENDAIKERSQEQKKNEISLTLFDVEKKWAEVLDRAKTLSPSVSFALKTAQPIALSGDVLTLGFQYELHQQRMLNGKVREVLESIFQELFSAPIKIQPKVNEKEDLQKNFPPAAPSSESLKNNKKDEPILQDVLEIFGGEVVR